MAGLQTSAFFFSSRRRHTRCSRDWSSDVCSSDLGVDLADVEDTHDVGVVETLEGVGLALEAGAELGGFAPRGRRSEERRVGKEGRSRGAWWLSQNNTDVCCEACVCGTEEM